MGRGEPDGVQFSGKAAIITGGAGGIGRSTALLFSREGAAVSIVDLNPEGEKLAREINDAGGRALFTSANVTSGADCRRVVERTVQEFGGVHVLFNNAGVIRRASVIETSEPEWDAVIAVNVKSIFFMCREVIPVMARAQGGSIINTASGWGLVGGERAAAYCASKGAVVLMTKAMALDHGRQNIRVNCLCPGDTDTAMLRSEARQLRRRGKSISFRFRPPSAGPHWQTGRNRWGRAFSRQRCGLICDWHRTGGRWRRFGCIGTNMRLKNKVALITGGTSGIGEATAALFASEGAKVTITGRNQERGQAVAGGIVKNGGEAIFVGADVRSAAECCDAVGQTLGAFKRLDILFNNAGVFYPHTVVDCTEESGPSNSIRT